MGFLYALLAYAALIVILFFVVKYREERANQKRLAVKTGSRAEIVRILMGLDEASIKTILGLYKEQFGAGPARYARRTFEKWRTGKVVPTGQTFERFMLRLPQIMSLDLKYTVVRHLIAEYTPRDRHELKIPISSWEESVIPLAQQIIDKAYTAEMPRNVEHKLRWLGDGDMVAAREIMRRSQVEEGRIAIATLRDEFENLESMLAQMPARAKISHTVELPFGSIVVHLNSENRAAESKI